MMMNWGMCLGFEFVLVLCSPLLIAADTVVCLSSYAVLPVANFRGGERHLKWLTLRGVKMGKLLVAVSLIENVGSDVGPNEPRVSECSTLRPSSFFSSCRF